MIQKPRLGVFHDSTSITVWPLFEAANEWCRIVWITGFTSERPDNRPLARFGDVVDLAGMSESEALEHLAAQRLDGVVVFSDPPLRIAAAVAERLGLPFHSPHTASLLSDKFAQRAALRQAGLPVPAFAAIRPGDVPAGVPFPAVLKPRAGAGSRDTFRADNENQVVAALAMCDEGEEFILEEWLPDRSMRRGIGADLVSIESIARDGVMEHIAVTGRFPFAPPFRETGSFLPSDLEAPDREAVLALASAALQAMHIRHGIVHTEIKLTPDGPRVIEVNGRVGGGISEMIARLGGPSLRVWAIRLALGHDVGPVPELPIGSVAFFRWIVAPQSATGLESMSSMDELSALTGIDEVYVNRRPGEAVDSREGSPRGHVVRIDGVVKSYDELSSLIYEQVESTLKFTWNFAG
jgi:hypothetical protein